MGPLLELLVFLIPPYIANSSPVILGGGMPMDLGKMAWDGRRVLGDGKTIRGFIGGVLAGTCAGALIAIVYPLPFFPSAQAQFLAAFLLSFGTLLGDAAGSFVKRRMGIESGSQFLLDSLLFMVVAMLLVLPLAYITLFDPLNLLFIFGLTAIMHPLSNMMANKAGLKKVPW